MKSAIATLVVMVAAATFGCDGNKTKNHYGERGHEFPPEPTEAQMQAKHAREAKRKAEREKWKLPKTRRMIDAHTHMSPYAYDAFAKETESLGIERIVNLSGGGSDLERAVKHLEIANKSTITVALFYNIEWSDIDLPGFGKREADRIRRAAELGYAGIKVSKALGLGVKTVDGNYLKIDDPRLDPIWAVAGELALPISIHTADPKAFFEKPDSENERYAELSLAPSWSFHGDEFPSRRELLDARNRVVAKHPKTTFILVHFANNPEDVDEVSSVLDTYQNAYVDISARVAEIGRHDPKRVREIFEKHRTKIMFGTDVQVSVRPKDARNWMVSITLGSVSDTPPTFDAMRDFFGRHFDFLEARGLVIDHPVPIQGDWKVKTIGLPRDVLAAVYYENAERMIFAPKFGRSVGNSVALKALAFGKPKR